MWRRALLYLALALLALVVVVVPGVIVILGQTHWARTRVQEALTRGLADYLHREVAVGRISGSLLDGFTADGLAIADGRSLRQGALLTAERVRVEYDLWSVLRGRLVPAASISAVHVYGPRVHLVHDARGRLNLAQLIPRQGVTPPERRFRGRVFAHDGAIAYEDHNASLRAPLFARADDVQLTADLSQVLRIRLDGSGRILDHRAGAFTVGAQVNSDRPFLNIDLSLDDVDLAWLAQHFKGAAEAGLRAGRGDVRGSLYTVRRRGKPRTGLSASLALRNLQIATGQPGVGLVTLDGGVWVGLDGVQARGLRATIAGSVYDVSGSAADLKKPVLDLALASGQARLQPLLQALPVAARRGWSVPQGGLAHLRAQVIGPAGNPDVRLRLGLPDGLTLKLADLGTVRAEGLEITAEAMSATQEPSVRATVTARRFGVPALKLTATEAPGRPHSLAIGPMQGFRATVQYHGGKPIAEAFVQTPYLRAGDLTVSNVSTQALLVNDLLRLRDLRAQALGGTIAAEASLLTSDPRAGVRARGTVRGLDLARLPEVPYLTLPDSLGDLGGRVNADFQVHFTDQRFAANASFSATGLRAEGASAESVTGVLGMEGDGALSGVGRLTATGLARGGLALDEADALVRFHGQQVEVLSGTARSPEGVAWARGEVDLAGKSLKLRVQGADLALGPLAERAGVENVKGLGYATGDLTGPFDDLAFTGRVMAFGPQLEEYALSALTTQARFAGDRLALTDLMATRGSGIVSGDLTLSKLEGPREQIALDGRLLGEGLDLQDMAQLLKQDQPVGGLAEFTAQVSGTFGAPRASGQLRLANATYEDFVVTRAEAPFTFADDLLTISHGQASVLDASVQVQGTLALGEPPQLDAYLSVGELPLEGLAPYLHTGLPMAGKASIERLWVHGPTNDLQGGARLTAQQVTIGEETIGDLDATLSLSRGQVQLHETSFALANGRVIVSGAYNTAAEPHTLAAQVQLLQTDLPDLLHLAVPIVTAVDTRPQEESGPLRSALLSYALRVKGVVDGTVNLGGPVSSPAATVDLVGERLMLDGRGLPQVTATAQVSKDAVQSLVLAARQGDALINADGDIAFDGPINLNVEGTGIAMTLLRPWIPLKTSFGGQLGFTVVAGGLTREPELMASVDIASPSFAGVQFDVLSIPVATVREGLVDVDTLTIKRGQTEIVLDGRLPFSWHVANGSGQRPGLVPDGQITMGGRIENTPLAFFLPLVDEYARGRRPPAPTPGAEEGFRWASIKTEGMVNSAVSFTGTAQAPTVRGFLKLDGGTVLPKQWTRALTELTADLQFSGTGQTNLVEIKSLAGRYDQTRGELTGRVGLQSVAERDFWRNGMDLRLALAAEQQTLPGGTELSGLQGALTLRTEEGAQVLRPEGLRVKVGGGAAELTGEARLRDFRVPRLAQNQFDLHLKMDAGRVRYPPYLDAMAQGSLSLVTPSDQAPVRVSGNWQFSDGVIGLTAPAAGLDTFAAAGSAMPAPELDLVAGLGEGMQLRGSSIKAPLLPDPVAAHLTGTPQQPLLVGDVATGRGTTMLPTATLRLRSLVVHYVVEPLPGDRSDPQTLRLRGTIDGAAETTISRPGASPVHILVKISGALPDQVAVTTSSEPSLTETQIYALLGGVPFAYLPGVGGGEAGLGQVLSEQFLAALGQVFQLRVFEPIEAELQRILGLELGITFAFNQPITLQVGKYVLRNLLITYERPLVESVERFDLRVSYELPHGLRITYHNDERNINQVEIGYSFTY